MKNFISAFVLSALFLFTANAQTDITKVSPEEAEAKLFAGNYEGALDAYLSLLTEDPKNDKYNYNVAVCYLNTNINKAKAVPYLELLTRKPKCDPNTWYLLGRAYHYANRFDEAITAYNKFKSGGRGTEYNLKDVDRQVQYCINAKELTKYPVNVTFENLGPAVNSEYNEHYAFVTVDESFVVFNTNRPSGEAREGEDGNFSNSVYFSNEKLGVFEPASCIGSPICKGNTGEEVVGLSAYGEHMLLYIKNKKAGKLYLCEKDPRGTFKTPVRLDKTIDTESEEIAASISSDGQIIYFASDREGGAGGTDIYMSKRLPSGAWSEAVNLGKEINTAFNEDFPNISPDGKTLYFSSNGHTSMGGYDIFKAEWDADSATFKNVKNVGFPINTTPDDNNFRISLTGRYGYISALRPGGLGDYDIYRVTFNEVEPELTVIKGQISAENAKVNYSDVFISVNDDKGELVGNYLPNPSTGKYVIILPPGKYSLSAEAAGFSSVARKIEVLGKHSYQSEVGMDITLQKGK